jgi:hypothetical protein
VIQLSATYQDVSHFLQASGGRPAIDEFTGRHHRGSSFSMTRCKQMACRLLSPTCVWAVQADIDFRLSTGIHPALPLCATGCGSDRSRRLGGVPGPVLLLPRSIARTRIQSVASSLPGEVNGDWAGGESARL